VVSEIGRWVGRARTMARQFREQLEEEVELEQARKAQAPSPGAGSPPPGATPDAASSMSASSVSAAAPEVHATPPPPPPPDTFSHAHPTDATGADPSAVRGATPKPDERGT
jgi:Sec-independent protein translocase protein TatA